MRWMLGFIVLFIAVAGQTQIIAFTSDTLRVGVLFPFDTCYYLRDAPSDASYIIYYDAAKTKIATSRTCISKNRYDVRYYYPNGQAKKFELNNDSLPYYHKDYISWFSDGHLERQVTTTRDSTLVISYWSNRQLQVLEKSWGAPWKHDYGHRIFWHGNGVLCEQNWFYPDSSITYNYHNDTAVSWIRVYHRDTTLKRNRFLYSDQTFHPDGSMSRSIVYPANGRQSCTYYYPSGAKKAECDWMEGNIGPYKEWHENGKIKSEGTFSVGIIYFPNQKITNYYPTKTGHWVYFNESGWIEKEEWRDFDGLVTVKEYNEKAEVIREYEIQVRIDAKEFPEEYRN